MELIDVNRLRCHTGVGPKARKEANDCCRRFKFTWRARNVKPNGSWHHFVSAADLSRFAWRFVGMDVLIRVSYRGESWYRVRDLITRAGCRGGLATFR